MKLKDLSIAAKIYGLLGGTAAVLTIGGLFVLGALSRTSAAYDDMIADEVAQQDAARRIQVAFKIQVQEWKNVLLRGHEQANLDKYRDRFFAREAEVQQAATALRDSIQETSVREMVQSFISAHSQMGPAYRSAMEAFERTGGVDYKLADGMVEGIDRAPTSAIDAIVDSLGVAVGSRQASLSASTARTKWLFQLTGLMALVAAGLAATYVIRRSIQAPMNDAIQVFSAVAKGDFTRQIDSNSHDEVGRMLESLRDALGLVKTALKDIADQAMSLDGSSSAMMETSNVLTANAEETSRQADVVSAAAQQVSDGLSTVSAASQEMGISIGEISRQTQQAASITNSAVEATQAANESVARLGQSSNEVGEVVKVIRSIAEQTNLLSLNATIEAARAGEAGKGFAVVANEVKELAKETAKATKDIEQRIQTIQDDTNVAIQSIENITEVINRVSDIAQSIASSVEEQSAATNEIGRSVEEAARGGGQIVDNIMSVAEAAGGTSRSADEARGVAGKMSDMAGSLRAVLAKFRLDAAA